MRGTGGSYQIQASAFSSSLFTLSGYSSKLSQIIDFTFVFAAFEPASAGMVASRRPRAMIEVIAWCLRAWESNSVATKPVEPPIMSFMVM